MRFTLVANFAHMLDHLAPIYRRLPVELRGGVQVPAWLRVHAATLNIGPVVTRRGINGDQIALVASHGDLRKVRNVPAILVEHGAGQGYGQPATADHPGGKGRDNVVLFLCPNETVAAANRAAYPNVPAVAVGSPKLDDWSQRRPHGDRPGTVIAFHWEDTRWPESRSAASWLRPVLADQARQLMDGGWPVLGHGHPRAWSQLQLMYERAGILTVPWQRDALAKYAVHVFDNTSHGFEAAALDRPVLLLNPPWYRRDVDHGLRFWQWSTIGPSVERRDQLADKIMEAWHRRDEFAEQRAAMRSAVFGELSGAADRAVAELLNYA